MGGGGGSGLHRWIADRRVAGGRPTDGFCALNKLRHTCVAWYASHAPMEWPKNTNGRWCRMGSSSGSISLQRGKEQQGREQ